MKLILVKLRDRTFKNFALICSLFAFLVACGGQESVDPNTGDTVGPTITLIDKGPETVIETVSDEILYIPNENISYQTSGSIFYTNESDELIEVKGEIIGFRQQHPIGTDYIDPGAEVSDLYSGDLPPITAASNINVNDPSDQVMTYTAVDFNENQSTLKRFFQLVDETAPTIKFNGDKDRIIYLDATANDDGDFIDSENNVLNIDTGAEGIDNLDNNIDLSKNKITIRKAVDDEFVEVSAVTTDEVAHFKIDYSFTDKSGNESTSTRNVFIRAPFNAEQPVFENGSVDPIWSNGIMAYDQGIPQYGSCSDGNGCPNIKWVTISDSTEYGNVLQVTHLDNDFDAGLFISSDTGIDLRGSEETGLLQLDIKRQSGSDPFIDIWADCGYPCAGGPSRQGPFRTGEWTRIYIPIKDIMEGPTSLLDLSIVKAGLLFKAASAKDAVYRIDNAVWLCETTCAGDSTPHIPFDWAATHEDPSQGYNAPQQGNHALKYVRDTNQEPGSVSIHLDTAISFESYENANNIFTARVHSTKSTDLTLKLNSNNEKTVSHSGNGWETLTFNFDDLDITQTSLILFINDHNQQGDENAVTTLFIDDLKQVVNRNSEIIPLTINFEEELPETYTIAGSNGGLATRSIAPIYDGYTLVWSDEFNGNMVNPANWDFDLGNGDNGWGNGELQHYREENATVDGGLLVIEAQKHQPKLAGDIGYTSSKLKTEDLFEFKYGRVDARAVAAKGQGLWSAIWMLGANHSEVGWPRSGEIDILDTIAGNRDGYPQEAMMVNNMYWNAEGSSPDAPYSLGSINQNGSAEFWLNEPLTGEMVTDEDGNEVPYQRPALWDVNDLPEWMAGPKLTDPETEETVRPLLLTGCEGDSCMDLDAQAHKNPVDIDNIPDWFNDNEDWENWLDHGGSTETFSNKFHVFSLIWDENKITFEVDGVETNSIDIKNALTEHYRQTFYLILNVAVGGNWPKAPGETTVFSDGMLVDYVRVYQADSDGDGVADHDWDGETVLDKFPNDFDLQ